MAARVISGLLREDAERVAWELREHAARATAELAPELTQLGERVERSEASGRYRRHSRSRALRADIAATVLRISGALARAHLPESAAWALARIEPLASPRAFEAAREEANSRHGTASGPAVLQATAGVLSSPPTDEQAAAIATGTSGNWGTWRDASSSGTPQPAVVTGLAARATYQFRVRAENGSGKGT